MYPELLKLYTEQGGYLHPDVTYKVVDEIGGMYATNDISNGTVIAKSWTNIMVNDPKSDLNPMENFAYYLATAEQMKFYLDHSPTYWEYERFHPYFMKEETIIKIKKYHLEFAMMIEKSQQQIRESADTILKLAPFLDIIHILRCLLIVTTKTWITQDGTRFIRPIIDLFNHHLHAPIPTNCTTCKDHEFTINKDIKKGEQIYISYGFKSIFQLYTTYGVFDPKGPSSLSMSIRIAGHSPKEYKTIKELKDTYGGRLLIKEDMLSYTTPNTFLLLENNPELNLLNFLMKYKNQNKLQVLHKLNEFVTGQISKSNTLDTIHSLDPNDFTEEEQVIKDILLIYKKIILGNLQWLKTEYDKIKLF